MNSLRLAVPEVFVAIAGRILLPMCGVLGLFACSLDDISAGRFDGSGASDGASSGGGEAGAGGIGSSSSTGYGGAWPRPTSTATVGSGGSDRIELCGDGLDNDEDGYVDCIDADCASVCTDSCTGAVEVRVPSTHPGSTSGASRADDASCGGSLGPEVVYEFKAPTDGTALVMLQSDVDLSLSVRKSCRDWTSELACSNKVVEGGAETLSLPVSAGESYFVVVDGTTAADVGRFTLLFDMQLPTVGERDCADFVDNDGDALVDCEDAADCVPASACIPGPGLAGDACAVSTDCHANHADPFCITEARFGWTNGYCSEFCDPSADDCGPFAVCIDVDLPSGAGLCFSACGDDADCQADYACTDVGGSVNICTPDEQCGNGVDDNGDGDVDCEDARCGAEAACQDPCPPVKVISLGTTLGDTRDGTAVLQGECTGARALEEVFTFVPQATGLLHIELQSPTDQGIYLRASCSDPTTTMGCSDAAFAAGTETLDALVFTGDPVMIVVDGSTGPADAGPYALKIEFR